MKYKPARDLPQFAQEYKTLSPSKLAKIVLTKRKKEKTPDSIRMWFKRHLDIHDQLAELIAGLPIKEEDTRMPTQEVLAELITNDYGNIKIRNLETVEIARKMLDLIEAGKSTSFQLTIISAEIARKILNLIEAKLKVQRGEPKRE